MASFTEGDMRGLLLAVGLNPVPADALESTFAHLELDSLARIEIATRLRESHGADVETALTTGDDLTPGHVIAMVNTSESSDVAGRGSSESGDVAGRGNTVAQAAG
jgi:Phosphopantetheine attachment site